MKVKSRAAAAAVIPPTRIRSDLEALAGNLWWSWNRGGELWARVRERLRSKAAPDLERNPVLLLSRLGERELRSLAADPVYCRSHELLMRRFRDALKPTRPPAGLPAARPVAYFSMEFGVHESLPVYAGGLGILAGDHAKSASDEGVPLVGVGLFYHNGYFRQELDTRREQRVVYPRADTRRLPIEPVQAPGGRELRVQVELPGRKVLVKVWRVRVGRVALLLLDADIPENTPEDRFITYRLYGGTREDRIRQEVVAGIGGVRALRALGIDPGVWHLNEGHVAFLTLERIREARVKRKLPVAEALEVIAADTVFTTHTPVPEGNEAFDLALARQYLAPHAAAAGMPLDDYLSLGLDHGKDGRPLLSMTVLALRLSRFRNGVSRLHGEVSRNMWSHLWPGFRAEDVPITSVTNGIHTQSWIAPRMDDLFTRHLGQAWPRRLADTAFWRRALELPLKDLWEIKQELKAEMIGFVRRREEERLERLGWTAERRRVAAASLLDPDAFTIGFARRFALYKRAALLFRDLGRARRLFSSRSRPLQIVFSGKPHPEDAQGKALFEEIAAMAQRPELRGRVVLLENYDIEVARHLVQGADLWLNNPRRPLEASGTSGQKVPPNCGLNLSVLDGWWCEGWSPRTGWAFGKPIEYADHDLQDNEDSRDLYRVLEGEVLPLYYRRDRSGVPVEWLRKVRTSMADLIPRFSTSHMVLEYAARLYRPAFENGRRIREAGCRPARDLLAWKERVFRSWPLVHLREARPSGRGTIEVEVFLADISPGDLRCRDEEGLDHGVRVSKALSPGLYRVEIPGALAAAGRAVGERARGSSPGGRRRTLRLFPAHRGLVHPQELGLAIEIVV